MSEEVIRYGAGGKPYVGQVGEKSTEAPAPVEEVEEVEAEEPKVEMSFEEDDTPLSDEDVVAKVTGKEK